MHLVEGERPDTLKVFAKEYWELQNKYRDNDLGFEDFYELLDKKLEAENIQFYRNDDSVEYITHDFIMWEYEDAKRTI